jgi:hypothetical protein
MDRRMKWSSLMLGSAGGILIVTAALHASGYRPLAEQLAASSIQPAWLGGIRGLWFVFSFHLVVLGVLFITGAARPAWIAKPILCIAGLVPIIDTVVLAMYVGLFVGTVLLALTALLVFGSVILRPWRAGRSV